MRCKLRESVRQNDKSVLWVGLVLLSFACRLQSQGVPSLPDVELLNERGEKVRFVTDVVQDRLVAVNTIFTTCTTICLPIGANSAKLSRLLQQSETTRYVRLISISVDPFVDTPSRLRQWADAFGPRGNWTLLTGSEANVTKVLKALGMNSSVKNAHLSRMLAGSLVTGEWTRPDSLETPAALATLLNSDAIALRRTLAAQKYFGDNPLLDQDGKPHNFYTDLLMGKVVVIDTFFASCMGSCPKMAGTFSELQRRLGDRLGKDVNLISISVDPANDTVPRLKEYADRFGAMPGWYFLTGRKDVIDAVLSRLGEYVQQRDDHSTLFLIGNERTGLWKKAMGLDSASQIMVSLESVIADK